MDKVLTFTEHTFQWKVEGKAFGWQANKQHIYPVVLRRKYYQIMKEGVLGATLGRVVREGFSRMSVELCQNERRGQMCADVG